MTEYHLLIAMLSAKSPPSSVSVCLAGWLSGCLSVCLSVCLQFLPFVSLVAYAVCGSPLSGDNPAGAFFVLSPLVVASGNLAYPMAVHRMRKSQRDAVAMARKVGVGA